MASRAEKPDALSTIGIRVFMFSLAVGAVVLQVATSEGGERVLSSVAGSVALISAWVSGRLLYRAAMRKERERQAPSASGDAPPATSWLGAATVVGVLAGPWVAALLSPLVYLPFVVYLGLVPIAYIDAGARDPSNPRVR